MTKAELLWSDISAVKQNAPLVHNITNYVVMNNTANALLAIGASPVMAHAIEEVAEMVEIASSLVINIGTLSGPWIDSMLVAGKAASVRGIPIILDPVGAGATKLRTDTAVRIIEEVKPDIIRANASETLALTTSVAKTKGVDSAHDSSTALESAKQFAEKYNCVMCISGAVDFITDGKNVNEVNNGSPLMRAITGMGCTASALCGAFAAINNDYFTAITNAMHTLGIAGEVAHGKANGPGTLQLHLYDALFNINKAQTLEMIK